MLFIQPDYYDDFACSADQCEDTCCAGWQIVVDEKSLRKYRKVQGPFRNRLLHDIHWRKGIFKQDKEKRCAFLNEENLCDMYTALGPKSLCKTCRRYPRHIEEFEGVRERTLSLSCPEVAKYLMDRKEKVQFFSFDNDKEEKCKDFEEMGFDLLLYDILDQGRQLMISILQDREYSMKLRCEKVLHLAADMESHIEKGNAFTCYDLFEQYKTGEVSYHKKHVKKKMDFSSHVLAWMFRLERLRDDWEMLLSESAILLYLNGESEYLQQSAEFDLWQKEEGFSLEIALEQLMVYYVMTYFCGSVYDGKIKAKVQSACIFTYIIYELWKARWMKNNHKLFKEDTYEIAYRFSRELEHSDLNLDRLERIAAAALPIEGINDHI